MLLPGTARTKDLTVDSERIFIGGGGEDYGVPQLMRLDYANRHGLIAGATGTGKTVTLQILAEGFSAAGVPVVLQDVKGDLSGLAEPGSPEAKTHASFTERAVKIGLPDYVYEGFPVTFWDIFGELGHPVRTTVAEMGPLLLSRLLELSEAQEGVLNIVFRVADEEGLPLLDLKDLQALLTWVGENKDGLTLRYGNISPATIGTIQRRLLVLETQGAAMFFGEPALDLADLMRTDADGRGIINILAAGKLMNSPRLYATTLLWLLSELFEELPEVGDPDKPKLVFFFDEAHLLFTDAPKALVAKVEQVARLIRSKGVGVYFITQNPADVPDNILGQLGNRIQHALRAFTAKDQRELKKAAETYRPNPRFDTESTIREVGTGEAVTSFLEAKGAPGIVERTLIRPPASRLGPIEDASRRAIVAASALSGKYDTALDRESAFERLAARAEAAAKEAEEAEAAVQAAKQAEDEFKAARRYEAETARKPAAPRGKQPQSLGDAMTDALIKELGGTTGRRIVRGILGGIFKAR
jgi:DNA helicase HerA-like ATPase